MTKLPGYLGFVGYIGDQFAWLPGFCGLPCLFSGIEKPNYDREKQGHVITADDFCQICTATVYVI